MKVFTHVPVGLGLSHREHETRAAMVWNRITADGSSPDTWFIATKIEIESFNYLLVSITLQLQYEFTYHTIRILTWKNKAQNAVIAGMLLQKKNTPITTYSIAIDAIRTIK